MSDEQTARARELIPDHVAGLLGPEDRAWLEGQLAASPELRTEEELVRAVHATRPLPPGDLHERIRSAVDRERELRPFQGGGTRRSAFRWSLSAAAAIVIAVGSAIVWSEVRSEPGLSETQLALEPVPLVLPSDDGMVAGEAVLDDLSDEDLRTLLEELGG